MADYPDRPGYSFDPGAPPEVARFLKNKGLRPSFSFEDVEADEHAVAFAVSKMAELDLLAAAKEEVQRAIDEGLSPASFRKNWMTRPALAQWVGRQVEDAQDRPGGSGRTAARRLKVIYDSNLRSARAAGQWERIQRTKDLLPFLEYRTGPSETHRKHHLEKAGTILPVDSPFWDEWMPPNGWGCKCWVKQITRREAERRGISPVPTVRDMVKTNTRTGEVRIVPEGIDPGWERNPGQLRLQAMEAALAGKLMALPESVARVALRDIATSWRVARIMDGAPGKAPVGMLSAEMAKAAGVSDPLIWVNAATFEHLILDHMDVPKEAAFRKELMAMLANIGDAVLAAVEERDDGLRTVRVLIPFTPEFYVRQSSKARKAERPTAVILWFDEVMRVRSVFVSSEKQFRTDVAGRGDQIIDLSGK